MTGDCLEILWLIILSYFAYRKTKNRKGVLFRNDLKRRGANIIYFTYLQVLHVNQLFFTNPLVRHYLTRSLHTTFNVHVPKFMRAGIFGFLKVSIRKDFRVIEDQKIVNL